MNKERKRYKGETSERQVYNKEGSVFESEIRGPRGEQEMARVKFLGGQSDEEKGY